MAHTDAERLKEIRERHAFGVYAESSNAVGFLLRLLDAPGEAQAEAAADALCEHHGNGRLWERNEKTKQRYRSDVRVVLSAIGRGEW